MFCPNCYHDKFELSILGYEKCSHCGYVLPIKSDTLIQSKQITHQQFETLRDVLALCNRTEFNLFLEKYTGITAHPCTEYQYFDEAGNFIGDSDNSDLHDLLNNAGIKIDGGGN